MAWPINTTQRGSVNPNKPAFRQFHKTFGLGEKVVPNHNPLLAWGFQLDFCFNVPSPQGKRARPMTFFSES